jgi:hypothetical protein
MTTSRERPYRQPCAIAGHGDARGSSTKSVGTDFDFDVRTNNFAAVNAYYHCDRFFRLVGDLGFDIPTYFGGTLLHG